jgi:hypothetical protein
VLRRRFTRSLATTTFLAAGLSMAATLGAQGAPTAQGAPSSAPRMGRDEIAAFAKLEIELGKVRDSAQAQLAAARNAKPEQQQEVRAKLQADLAEVLHHNNVTEADYRRREYVISTDPAARKMFDSVTAQLTGAPLPGTLAPAAPPNPQVKVPAGPVGTHIAHVMNGFSDTPNGMGLLPVAEAEAKTAAQHAALAARDPANLAAMKLHAGHVLNALDPSIVPMGPGLGYGLKKATNGVVTHIELAAKAQGASQNVVMHANHVATASRSTIERADSAIAIAKSIQAAASAADAAKLVNQLVPITQQLMAGVDRNGDGRIGWDQGEGGLQQASEHIDLLLKGEKMP